MTRGRFIIIAYNFVGYTTEFNGDMYPGGVKDIWGDFKVAKTSQDLEKLAKKWNKRYNYEGNLVTYRDVKKIKELFHFKHSDYFEKWFSDWLYISNVSQNSQIITTRGGEQVNLKPGQVLAFNFGDLPDENVDFEAGKISKIGLSLDDYDLSLGKIKTSKEDLIKEVKNELRFNIHKHAAWILNYAVDTVLNEKFETEDLEELLGQLKK